MLKWLSEPVTGVVGERPASTEHELFGDGWHAVRADGRCRFDYQSGKHGGGGIAFDISESEFALLKAHPERAGEIIDHYSNLRGDGWIAGRSAGGCWARVHDIARFARTGSFPITEAEFTALRDQPSMIDGLYEKHRTKAS